MFSNLFLRRYYKERRTDLNLAERVRRELNTALSNANGNTHYRSSGTYTSKNVGNGIACTTQCQFSPGAHARSQTELDAIAREMTSQIIRDLQAGKVTQSQLNQPNWYENRVAGQFSDLQQQHNAEFERNVQSVSNRFHHSQQQQQQQQHHGSQFQQQSQTFGFVQPIVSGKSYQKVVEEHHNERNSNAAYPTPVTLFHGAAIFQQNNCTDGVVVPQYNVQNQFKQHAESSRHVNGGSYVQPIIRGGHNYRISETIEQRKEHHAPTYVAPIIHGGNNYHISETIEQRKEHRVPQMPIIIPTQNTYSRKIEEEQREVHHQRPQIPQYYGVNHHDHKTHIESSSHRNVQIVTPAPIPYSHKEHAYNEFHESEEFVPNYRPRVVLDKNTKFHELEVRNRQYEERPIIIPTATTSTTHVEEEERIDRQYQQKPIYHPPITQTVTKEEEEQVEINQQKVQQPIYQPQPSTITHTESEDIQRVHHVKQPQPQYPIFSHTTNVNSYNESRNTNTNTHTQTQTIYQQPTGQTVTIKETHFVKVLPQPVNQYAIESYTTDEYLERLHQTQQELRRLGYGELSEEEYNSTISSGGFIHNGFKYLYNADHGRYEKNDRVEVDEEEYHALLRGLQMQLRQLGVQMTEREYNQTIEDGYFIQNGIRYNFDSETGKYYRQEVDEERYELLRHRIQEESNRHGWSLNNHEINQTIATGVLIINGHRYILNKQTGTLEQGEDIQISEQEYRTILRRLQEQLTQLGYDQMTEREYNHTISTGYFVRGGQKYRYNADIGRYERVELTDEEYRVVTNKLRETLQKLNYRQMGEHELNETIASGSFIRGGYQWNYNTETGDATAVRVVGPLEELTQTEYTAIYRTVQNLLRSMGYPEMTESECNSTIQQGTFSRGGNQWVYQPSSGEFRRIDLTESEYNYRVNRLVEILNRLGIQKTNEEQREIIYRGTFYYGGHRYEYDASSGLFVRVEMSEAEYQERVRRLLEQLQRIGYGTMSESECRATINSGIFYYGGHEWVYNYQTGEYEMGRASNKENGIVDDNYFNNIGLDVTNYGTSKTDEPNKLNTFDIDKEDNIRNRKLEIINKDRGDQPPQTFIEDYDESEEVTQRPIPPVSRPPATRPPFTSTFRPVVMPTMASYSTQTDRSHYENEQHQTIYAVPTPQTEYEETYHHKKTTYTKTSGYVSGSLIR